jgi:hypothetical protein
VPFLAEEHEVVVVAEQAVGVNLERISVGCRFYALQEDLTIDVAAEDRRPIDAAAHHMLPCTFVVFTSGAGHG